MRFLLHLHLHLLTTTIVSLIGVSHGFAFAFISSTRGHHDKHMSSPRRLVGGRRGLRCYQEPHPQRQGQGQGQPWSSFHSHFQHQFQFQLASTPSNSNNNSNINNSSSEDQQQLKLKIIDNIISDMHESKYPFRIIVIGNGASAILETTSILGPTMKSSVSSKSNGNGNGNQRLVTLASLDQSFEFHIKVDDVAKIHFVEMVKPVPATATATATATDTQSGTQSETLKVLRICRFVREDGGSICSLILNETGEDAVKWFQGMKDRYGEICINTNN
jgi:hypothetical protein